MRLDQLAKINITLAKAPKVNAADYAKFERNVKKKLEELGYMMIRGDHKNFMPDWIRIDSDNKTRFVECKMYTKCVDPMSIPAMWRKKQPKQFETHMNLVEAGCELDLWVKCHSGETFVLEFRSV